MLDRLTLDQLRTLIAVADSGSFSAAGRNLRRVQSAVSQTMQALESTLGVDLFDRSGKVPALTDAGKVILDEARKLVRGAEGLRAKAESIASDVEPELPLAVDAMFPNLLLMESLKILAREFPDLPVTVFTEALGGAEQRIRDHTARLGLYTYRPVQDDLASEFLAGIAMAPVAASHHALAKAEGVITREMLEEQVQLVLTDRTQITARFSGGVISRRIWRFADLGTRLEYLLEGFGWCNMPLHLVEPHIKAGRLRLLDLADAPRWELPIHVVHDRARPLQRAGRMLIEDLKVRLTTCPGHAPVKGPKR